MSSRAQRLEHLRSLGLSPYQARLYLNLLEQGEASAGQLAKRAGIPRGRIYEILRVMEARGLVNFSPEKPTKFSAVPAAELLERHESELRKSAEDMLRDRKRIESMFQPARGEEREQPPRFHVVRGRRQVASRFRALAREAVKSVEIQLSAEAPADARPTVAGAVTEAFARRVDLRMVSCFDDSVPAELARLAEKVPGRLRMLHAPHSLNLLVADRRSLLLWNARTRAGDEAGDDEIGILTDDEPTVRSFRELLEERWASAGDPAVVLERLRAGAPVEGFVLIRSSEEALARYQVAVKGAKADVFDLTSSARLAQLAREPAGVFSFPLRAAVWDLVHITPENAVALERFSPKAKVSHLPTDFGLRFSVVDGRETFIFSPVHGAEDAGRAYADTLYSDNPEVAKVYRAVFEHLWSQSIPVEEWRKTGGPRREFVVIRSGAEAQRQFRARVEDATSEVLDLTSGPMLARIRPRALTKMRVKPGVRCRDLAYVDPGNLENIANFLWPGELRHTPGDLGLRFTVVDGRHVFVFPPVAAGEEGDDPYAGTVYCDDPEVASTYRNIFDHLWAQSIPFEARAQQIHGGELPQETRVVVDRERALETLRAALESSKVEILSMSTGDALLWRIKNLDWLDRNFGRVPRRMILQATGKGHPVMGRLTKLRNLEVRTMDHDIGLRMAVVDRRTVLLVPQGKGSESALSAEGWKGHGGMIVSNDPAFAEVYARLFRELWDSAREPDPAKPGYRIR